MRAVICIAFSFVSASLCLAAEQKNIGKSMPLGTATQRVDTVSTEWESVASEGLSGKTIKKALSRRIGDRGNASTRGPKEIELYKTTSPAVVLVVNDDGLGSGSYLGDGQILTNWHVVGGFKEAAVIFKPKREGVKVDASNVIRAEVVKVDRRKDLALLKIMTSAPDVKPLQLGSSSEIQIGADVHAIGHPSGETWTYTRGLISQYRKDYEWKTKSATYRADVIQTQTPVNPGNSGGPLIGDSGKILGVNSFKADGENLNFAVSVEDIQRFISSPGEQIRLDPAACKPKMVYEGLTKDGTGKLNQYDTGCYGFVDFSIVIPSDPKLPMRALIDTNKDKKVDVVVQAWNRDKRWEISFHDVDFDGVIDVVGFHPDGKLKASYFEKYNPKKTYASSSR